MTHAEWKAQQRQKQLAEARPAYKALTEREAAGKLGPKDFEKLDELIQVCGYTAEQHAAHGDAVTLAERLAVDASRGPKLAADLATVEAEAKALGEAWEKTWRAHEQQAATVNAKLRDAHQAMQRATAAAEQLEELRTTHWQFFGQPDPAIAARQRTLASALLAPAPTAAIVFEAVMAEPDRWTIFDDPRVEIVGDADLIAVALQLIRDGRPAWYVLPASAQASIHGYRDRVRFVDDLRRMKKIELRNFLAEPIVVAPGQTAQALDRIIAKLRKLAGETPKPQSYATNETEAREQQWQDNDDE